jgi:hypothetical protein
MNHKITGGRARWSVWPLGMVVSVALLTAACGGSGTPTSTATSTATPVNSGQPVSNGQPGNSSQPVGNGQPGQGGPPGQSGQQSASPQVQKYWDCMRTHGVPTFGGPTPPSNAERASATFQNALKACQSVKPAGSSSGSGGNGS